MVPSKPSVPRSSSVRLALAAAAHDEPVRRLVVPRFLPLGWLAPGRNRMAAARLDAAPGRSGNLTALAGLHPNMVHDRADRDAAHRHGAGGLYTAPLAR